MITFSDFTQQCHKENLAVTLPTLCFAGALKVILSSQLPKLYQKHFPVKDLDNIYNKQTRMTIYNILIRVANANLVTKLILELESLYDFDEATDHSIKNIAIYAFLLGSFIGLTCQTVDSYSFSTSSLLDTLPKKYCWSIGLLVVTAGIFINGSTNSCLALTVLPIASSLLAVHKLSGSFLNLFHEDSSFLEFKGKTNSSSNPVQFHKPLTPFRLTLKFACGMFLMAWISRNMSIATAHSNNMTALTGQILAGVGYSFGAWIMHLICSIKTPTSQFFENSDSNEDDSNKIARFINNISLEDTDYLEAKLSAFCVFLETFVYYIVGFEPERFHLDSLPLAIKQEANVCLTTLLYVGVFMLSTTKIESYRALLQPQSTTQEPLLQHQSETLTSPSGTETYVQRIWRFIAETTTTDTTAEKKSSICNSV
ncbi:MAG: hypothetical protein CL816_01725 [Coxiellaceae bacterium]|nr:hypothetical protein [Coxiellaceae bacterium]|tara:strand:- start:352 stop:1629 length:1278 start_codon:yes stop_codon:yes gene_type:complete